MGVKMLSRKEAIWAVGQDTADTMGRPGLLGLWILGSMEKTDVLGCRR